MCAQFIAFLAENPGAVFSFGNWDLVGKIGSSCALACRKGEDMEFGKSDGVNHLDSFLEVNVALSGESGDEIGSEGSVGADFFGVLGNGIDFFYSVSAVHAFDNTRRSTLDGEVEMIADAWIAVGLIKIVVYKLWTDRRNSNAGNGGLLQYLVEEVSKFAFCVGV